jgi:hypothetical protein
MLIGKQIYLYESREDLFEILMLNLFFGLLIFLKEKILIKAANNVSKRVINELIIKLISDLFKG